MLSRYAWRRRSNGRRAELGLLVALIASGVVGCGGGHRAPEVTRAASATPGRAHANPHLTAPGARLRIVSPARGETVGRSVGVKVEVRGFHLSAGRLDMAPKRGWGHLHLRLDGGRYDREPFSGRAGKLAARLGVTGRFTPVARTAMTYDGVPPGRHRLVVSLASDDLSETGVTAQTVFTVR